jgi:hypothetical protein
VIGVRINGNLVVNDRPKGSYYVLRCDVMEWLLNNVGLGSSSGGYMDDCDWLWTYDTRRLQGAVVVINDPDKAMMFKLTWGGL